MFTWTFREIFSAVLFLIAKNCEQFKYPSTDKWKNTMWYIHTMGYYSAVKKGELLINATK